MTAHPADKMAAAKAAARTTRASWSKDQVQTLRQMWLSGSSDAELTASLGRSANAIAIKAHRLGLPPRAEAVAALAGEQANPPPPRRSKADIGEIPLTRPKPTAKIRKCLMCRSDFWSSHAGERICGDCKSTDFWRNGSWISDTGGYRDDDWW